MSSFDLEKRTQADGSTNIKYIDVLDEDTPIQGQNFVSLSFIMPEKILKKRDLFFFEQFVKMWDITEARKEMLDFIHYIAYNYNLDIEDLLKQYGLFIKDTSTKYKKHEKTTIQEDYATFIEANEERLQKEFDDENGFKTSVRGIKVRGVYSTLEQAQQKTAELRKSDPDNNISIGEVGKWLAFDPDLYKTGGNEYMEEELNQLYKEKIKNEISAKEHFENRKREAKRKAIEENIKKSQLNNTTVSQTIDEDGNLTAIKDSIDFASREVAPDK